MRVAHASLRIGALLLASAAGPAFGDCRAIYPAARVTEKLADPRYQSCDAVAQDYAEFLIEQGSLLGVLRPAYQRKLKLNDGQAGDPQAQLRLNQYDENIRKLLEVSTALRQIPAASAPASAAAPAASASGGGRAAARQRLKESRALSQSLSDRIAVGVDEFQTDEMTSYCKQDYLFRVSGELYARLAACLRGD